MRSLMLRGWFILLFTFTHSLYALELLQIHITGVKGELLNNVLTYLSLEQQKNHPRFSERRLQRLHQLAPEEIQKALQPFGYYHVKVSSTLTPPGKGQTTWKAHYVINLGTPLKISEVHLEIQGEGHHDGMFQKLSTTLPIKVGDPFISSNYEKSKSLLRGLAEERGYFDAQWNKSQVFIDEQADTAKIFLELDTQQRYHFGEVIFKQDTFNESLLKKFLLFSPGEAYTSHQLLAFKNALINSNYFEKVDVELERLSAKHLTLVHVTLEPKKPNYYSFAIGYGTDTGVRGGVGWERRFVNRQGHSFSAKAELSQIRQSVTAAYTIPTGQIGEKFVTLGLGYKDENTRTSDSRLFKLGISETHPRRFWHSTLREVLGIEYRDEQYTVGDDSGHAKFLMPNVSWSYLKADDRLYTLHGHKIQLDLRGALNHVASNTSFLQTKLSGTLIRQLHEKGRVIARGEAAYSLISLLDGEFKDLPPSIRFFAGGDRSVRGYDYQTLGPKNNRGDVIGGKNLLVGSLEYEHKIFDKWSLATFYDVGNAFNNVTEQMKHGAGLGIRWYSPVGLIRLDVACALNEEGRPLRLHIVIGPDL